MIVEWFFGVGVTVINALCSTINGWSPDAWFIDVGQSINSVTSTLDGLGVWVNWAVIGACTASVLASWTLFGNVKLARVGISHVPQFGGGGN